MTKPKYPPEWHSERSRFERQYCPEPNTGCWLWTGDTFRTGYGRFRADHGRVRAHRYSYVAHGGTLAPNMVLDHLCRTPACVNPEHLEQVPPRINVLRGTSPAARRAKQTHCKSGHLFDEQNTYVRASGWRRCRRCHATSEKRRTNVDGSC